MEIAIYIFQKTIFGIGIYVEFPFVSVSSPLVVNVRGFIGRSPNNTRSLSKRGLEPRAVEDQHQPPTTVPIGLVGGGFTDVLFLLLLGEMIQVD